MGRPKGSRNKTEVDRAIAMAQPHEMRKPEWLETHALIFDAMKKHWVSSQKVISNRQIAQITGLSYETVRRHFEVIDPSVMKDLLKEQASLMVQPIMWGMYNGAMKGSPEAAKILLKLGADFAMVDDNPMANTNILVMSDDDIVTAESKLLKFSRRVKRDHKLGVVEGEVVDATENN